MYRKYEQVSRIYEWVYLTLDIEKQTARLSIERHGSTRIHTNPRSETIGRVINALRRLDFEFFPFNNGWSAHREIPGLKLEAHDGQE